MRLLALVVVAVLAFAAPAGAQSVNAAANALKGDPIYIAPEAELSFASRSRCLISRLL